MTVTEGLASPRLEQKGPVDSWALWPHPPFLFPPAGPARQGDQGERPLPCDPASPLLFPCRGAEGSCSCLSATTPLPTPSS